MLDYDRYKRARPSNRFNPRLSRNSSIKVRLGQFKHDLVRRSTARSYLGTINQHDHVLRSKAWSCFSFRLINQHDHVLRSNAWSCFSFRTIINHMTMSFVVMLGHISFSGMRPVGPGCVSGQDTLLKVAQY